MTGQIRTGHPFYAESRHREAWIVRSPCCARFGLGNVHGIVFPDHWTRVFPRRQGMKALKEYSGEFFLEAWYVTIFNRRSGIA